MEKQSLRLRMPQRQELYWQIKSIESSAEVIYRIHILGSYANIAIARDAVCNLIMGTFTLLSAHHS